MKAIFLSLLLANLAYLGWQAWIVPQKAPALLNDIDGVPRLVMIGEDPDNPGPGAPYKMPTGASEIMRSTAAGGSLVAVADPSEAQDQASPADDTAEQAIAAAGRNSVPASGPADDAPSETVESIPDEREPVNVLVDDTTSEPVEVAVAPERLQCVSLGPFLNLREAAEASAMLIEAGLATSQRLSESQVWFGHWVHLPALATREAAVAVVEDLKKNGVTDIYIEPSGPMKNSISLGVFSDREHAETRAGQIRRFGISPQIRDRYRDSSVYWVDFQMPPGQPIDPSAYQASPNRVLRIETRTCPEEA